MAYTRSWNAATPLGSEDADTIDDIIRDKLVDLEERLDDIIGADSDMTQDPVVPTGYSLTELYASIGTLNASLGSVTGIKRMIPWQAGRLYASTGTLAYADNNVTVNGASESMQWHVPLTSIPVGCTITEVALLVKYQSTNHAIAATFKGVDQTGSIVASSFTTPSISGSAQWWTKSGLSLTVLADTFYFIDFTMDNQNLDTSTDMIWYGARVTITHPGGAIR